MTPVSISNLPYVNLGRSFFFLHFPLTLLRSFASFSAISRCCLDNMEVTLSTISLFSPSFPMLPERFSLPAIAPVVLPLDPERADLTLIFPCDVLFSDPPCAVSVNSLTKYTNEKPPVCVKSPGATGGMNDHNPKRLRNSSRHGKEHNTTTILEKNKNHLTFSQ